MIQKTKAICLKSFSYKESSLIASLLTEDFGLKTCIIKGGRKPSAKIKSAYFQPLQTLDIVLYEKNQSSFCQIKECNLTFNLNNIYTDMIKISLSMFITEVLSLSIKEDSPNKEMFSFINQTIHYLNDCHDDSDLKDLHIFFLYHLAALLGFEPMNNFSPKTPFFDINKGIFVENTDIQTLDKESSWHLHEFLSNISDDYSVQTSSAKLRTDLLNVFILFFEQHITNNRHIQSQTILHSILE